MIKTPVSGQLECLTNARIHHSLFISQIGCELHLWDADKLRETLELLQSREIQFGSIVKQGDGDIFYIIKF